MLTLKLTMKNIAIILSSMALLFTACSKNTSSPADQEEELIGGDVGAEFTLILPNNEQFILRKENVTSPVWRAPIVDILDGGIKELGFITIDKHTPSGNDYTLTTSIYIKDPGSYPLVSNKDTRDVAIIVGMIEKVPGNNLDEIYAMNRGEEGVFIVESMGNGVLKGRMQGTVTLHSLHNPGKQITIDKMTLNLKYLLASDI